MILIGMLILFIAWACILVQFKQQKYIDNLRSCITQYKMWYAQIWDADHMGKYKGIIKTLVDFGVFWMIFCWKDGYVFSKLSRGVRFFLGSVKNMSSDLLGNLTDFKNVLLYLSPYGRTAAYNEAFRYCLIYGSVVAAVSLIIYIFALEDEWNWFVAIIVSPIASIAVWYLFYFLCYFSRVYAITTWFYFWATILSILLALFSFSVITYLLSTIFL